MPAKGSIMFSNETWQIKKGSAVERYYFCLWKPSYMTHFWEVLLFPFVLTNSSLQSLFFLISRCISVMLVAPHHPTLVWDTVQHLASVWRILEQISRQWWGNARHQWSSTRHDSSLISASSLIVAHLPASDLILPPAHHCTLPFSHFCALVTRHVMF